MLLSGEDDVSSDVQNEQANSDAKIANIFMQLNANAINTSHQNPISNNKIFGWLLNFIRKVARKLVLRPYFYELVERENRFHLNTIEISKALYEKSNVVDNRIKNIEHSSRENINEIELKQIKLDKEMSSQMEALNKKYLELEEKYNKLMVIYQKSNN